MPTKFNFTNIPSTLSYDISLVRLSSPVTFGTTIRPACLSMGDEPAVGSTVTVAGFGKTGQNSLADQLRAVFEMISV